MIEIFHLVDNLCDLQSVICYDSFILLDQVNLYCFANFACCVYSVC